MLIANVRNFVFIHWFSDQFKYFIFIAGLQFSHVADVRTRLLSKLQQHKDVAVKVLTTESQRFMNFKKDTSSTSALASKFVSSIRTKKKLSCDEWHYTRFCPSKIMNVNYVTNVDIRKVFVVIWKPNLQIKFRNKFQNQFCKIREKTAPKTVKFKLCVYNFLSWLRIL